MTTSMNFDADPTTVTFSATQSVCHVVSHGNDEGCGLPLGGVRQAPMGPVGTCEEHGTQEVS